MKYILRLFRHFWAVWGLLYFILVALVLFPVTYVAIRLSSGKGKFRAGMGMTRFWATILLYGMGMPPKTSNAYLVKQHQPAIIVTNHVSQIDILASAATIPINFKYLSKKEVTRLPVVGYLVRQLHVLVDRKDKESRGESINEMVRQVQAGHTLNIYPEGTRNKGPALLKGFYDGAFRLAISTQRPIIPMTILNNWNRENQHTKVQLNPGPVRVIFDKPVSTAGYTMRDIPKLKMKVRKTMMERLEPIHGKEYSIS